MKIKRDTSLLPDELHPDLKSYLVKEAEIIKQFVNYGLQIFNWLNIHYDKVVEYPIAIILLLKSTLENAESVAELVSESLVYSSMSIVRVIFEQQLYLMYLAESPESIEKRCFAYLANQAIKKQVNYDKYDSKTNDGKQFLRTLKGSPYENLISEIQDVTPFDSLRLGFKERKKNIKGFGDACDEYDRIKSEWKKHSKIHFYSLYNELRSLEELSKFLGRHAEYQIMYRYSSSFSHSSDVLTGSFSPEAEYYSMKNPMGINAVVRPCLEYLGHIYEKIISNILTDKIDDYNTWVEKYCDKIDSYRIELIKELDSRGNGENSN